MKQIPVTTYIVQVGDWGRLGEFIDEERAASLLKLIDTLEDNDDVQNVYANFEIPDAVLQALSA